jgi:hypothetical protein
MLIIKACAPYNVCPRGGISVSQTSLVIRSSPVDYYKISTLKDKMIFEMLFYLQTNCLLTFIAVLKCCKYKKLIFD